MHGATEGLDVDHVLISADVRDRHHAAARDTAATTESIRRWWVAAVAIDVGDLGYVVSVDVADEIGVVMPDGRLRIVADVSVARARVVATLLGAVAEPGEWAMRSPTEWPS